jgi:HAD superfamily hydrolase (TIGR01509 family)
MALLRPAAVVFDMDGLMLDTEPLAARAWGEAAAALGVDYDTTLNASLVGRNFPDCRALIVERHGAGYPVDALMSAWHAAYDDIVEREGIALKAGLLELVAWLEGEGVPRAVATSTRRSRALAKLGRTGLAGRFHAIVGGDEPRRGKPAPDIFLLAAERLGVPAASCVVLEDSEPGVRGALAAGMTPFLVPDGVAPSAALRAAVPHVFADLHGVRAHLAGLPSA